MVLGKLLVKFRATAFLYWSFMATFSCYYVLFFESGKQIAPSTIGMMMAVYTIATMIGQYFWGYVCDKFDSIKRAYLLMTVVSAVVMATFPFNNNVPLLFVAMAALGFSISPMSPLSDAWVIKHLSRYGLEGKFGTVRSFGSMGWSLTACATAYLISWFGWNIMYAVGLAAAALLFFTAMTIDDVTLRESDAAAIAKISPLTAARELFKDRAYVFIVIVLFFHFLGLQTAYNYLGLIMKNTGGGVIHLGWTYLLDAGSEVPSMFLSVWLLKRFSQKRIILVAMLLYIARFAVILYFQTATAVMFSSIMQGLAFGLLLTALRNYIFTVAPERFKTMAFTVGEACYINLAVIVGASVGGFVVERAGVFTLVACCAVSSALAFLLLAYNVFVLKKG